MVILAIFAFILLSSSFFTHCHLSWFSFLYLGSSSLFSSSPFCSSPLVSMFLFQGSISCLFIFLCFQPETKVTKRMKEGTKNRASSKKKERERNYLHREKKPTPLVSAKYRTNQALLKTSFY